ncbi:unknown [Ruminococcus sp. CAG:563]|nr:unknown [Ruminococcus sp. CAG:563]
MKKTIAVLLAVVISMTFFACGKKEGDLGKQTTVDKKNGYTLVEEVLTFKYNDDEEEIKKNPNAKTDGFVTNESNAVGKVNTKSAVLDIAKKEVSDRFNKINFAFDRTQGIWRVTFSMDTVSGEKTTSEKVMTVYVDEDGYTLATIKA